MRTRDTVLSNILSLEEVEHNLVDSLFNTIKNKNVNSSLLYDNKELIRHIFEARTPQDQKANSDGNWVNATDGIGLLSQLIYNSNIVIDLKPNIRDNEQFIKLYGCSVQQMVTLARKKEVSLNLIGYDSNKDLGFEGYLMFEGTSQEEASYCDLFSVENGIKINSLRRKLFFDLLLSKGSYGNLIDEGRNIFSRIGELPLSEQERLLKSSVFRTNNLLGLIESLAQQYAYNKSMSRLGKVPNQLESIINSISDSPLTTKNIVKYSEIMRGLKVLIASPLLASMGGTYSMSYSSVAALKRLQDLFGKNIIANEGTYNVMEKNLEQYNLKEENKKFILSTILKKKEIVTSSIMEGPIAVKENRFSDYLDFIKDIKEVKNKLNERLDSLSLNPYLNEARFEKIEMYMQTQSELLKSYSKFCSTAYFIFVGTASCVPGVLLGREMPDNGILNKFAEHLITAVVTKTLITEETFEKAMQYFYSNKHQVLLDIEGIKRLINVNSV